MTRFVVLAALCSACLRAATVTCADGRVCAADKVCVPGGCANPDEITACQNSVDGATCSVTDGEGRCHEGRCVVGAGCGDGILDLGEACDDGNTVSGDGCRGDCMKVEVCGDGVVDDGEDCDDNNHNPADACDACRLTRWTASLIIPGDSAGIDLNEPTSVAFDALGNLYIADHENDIVRRVTPDGTVTAVAGGGAGSVSIAGSLATATRVSQPGAVVVDGLGNVYIAQAFDAGATQSLVSHVLRVDAITDVITIVAGLTQVGVDTGTGFGGDGGPATAARLDAPYGITMDGLGNIYVADTFNHRIRRIGLDGIITTIAGSGATGRSNGGFSGDGGAATSATLDLPSGLALDPAGNIYIADTANNRIRRIDATSGVITTIAGTGTSGFSGDGGLAQAANLGGPQGVARDSSGNLYIADTRNNRIRRIDASTGVITTIGGTGATSSAGDNGPAALAAINRPRALAFDREDNLAVAESGGERIRKIAVDGTIRTIIGTGHIATTGGGSGADTEGSAATCVRLQPSYTSLATWAIAIDSGGNLFASNIESVHEVDATTGALTTLAGNGVQGTQGDGGPARDASLFDPQGAGTDSLGNVYISTAQGLRRVDRATGIITFVSSASPRGFAHDGNGNLYFTDFSRIRMRAPDGTITVVAGTGVGGSTGDGGLATNATFARPTGLAVDAAGNLYIADGFANKIRRVTAATGIVDTVVGTGAQGFSGDSALAINATLSSPEGVAVDAAGTMYIADTGNHRVRRVDTAGVITTIVGTGTSGYGGDGGPALDATLYNPSSLLVDGAGRLVVSERAQTFDARVRRIDLATHVITTIVGAYDPVCMGPAGHRRLSDPRALVVVPGEPFSLIAGGASTTVQQWNLMRGTLEVVTGSRGETTTTTLAHYRPSFFRVGGVAYDPAAHVLYASETDNKTNHRLDAITLVDPNDVTTWTIGPVAAGATFNDPTGLYFDGAKKLLYVADTGSNTVIAVDLSMGIAAATVSTVVGVSMPGLPDFAGDGGPATAARLAGPEAVTVAANGDLFVADTGNNRVRRIEAATGRITTVLGDGVAASSGEGAPASIFPVDEPRGLAGDALGNIFVSSRSSLRLLPATDQGVVDGTGSVETIYGAPPHTEFPASVSHCLTGVTVVDGKTVQLVDACTGMLVSLTRAP